jgi:hypothetical protein
MAMEPITLFARLADPAGVARRLREVAPDVAIDGPDENWRKAVVTFGKGRRKQTLTFNHDPDYYAEPGWSRQMDGMRGYFSRFPDSPSKSRVMALTTTFRFSLGAIFDPDFDPAGDPRLDILFAVAEGVDGVLFTPSGLRDAQGRILFSADGPDEEDPDAVWPRVVGQVSMTTGAGAEMHERSRPRNSDEDEGAATAPSAARVARRALALTAVTVRAILEQDPKGKNTAAVYKELLAWVKATGIDDEFEPDEREVVHRRPGKLTDRQQIDSTWRLEGLVVLAWALGRFEVPPHDQLVDFNPLWQSLGWSEPEAAKAGLVAASLRPRAEIMALRNRLFALHWRLRNFRIRPEVMDFAEFARTCWFGPLDTTGLPLIDGDLGIGGERLDRADPGHRSTTHSAAQERHQAVNWLYEGPETYSEASVAT